MANDGLIQHDIAVDFPHSDYLLDVELKTDFATSNMKMILLSKGSDDGKYHRVAVSKWENQEMVEDFHSVPVD
jgi:hypothetical protein